MEKIYSVKLLNVGSYSAVWVRLSYEKRRNGAVQEYKFQFEQYISDRTESRYQYGYYGWAINNAVYLDNTVVWRPNHALVYSAGWYDSQTSGWIQVPDKYSGTTAIKFTSNSVGADSGSVINYTSTTLQLPIDPAGAILENQETIETNYGSESNDLRLNLNKLELQYYCDMKVYLNASDLQNDIPLNTYYDIENEDLISFTANEVSQFVSDGEVVERGKYRLYFKVLSYTDEEKTQLIGEGQINNKCLLQVNGLEPIINTETITNSTSSISGTNIISGKSTINISIPITLIADATIVSASIAGESVEPVGNTVSKEFVNCTINNFNISITDSRGYTITKQVSRPMITYKDLGQEGTYTRNTPVDGLVNIYIKGVFDTINFGISSNTLTIKYKVWEYGTTEPGTWQTIPASAITIDQENDTFECTYQISNIDYQKRYYIKTTLYDLIDSIITDAYIISKGIPVFYWNENNMYIGASGTDNKLFLNGEEVHPGGGTVDTEMSSTSENAVQNKVIKAYIDALGTIQEVGDANGGHYIKYTNGIMICTKAISGSVSIRNSGVMVSSWSTGSLSLGAMPANFVSVWSEVAMAAEGWGTSVSMFVTAGITGDTTSSMGSLIVVRPSGTATATVYAKVIAIGTWK